MDGISILQGIYEVARLIYDYTELVKANKSQSRRLAERVKIITSSLHRLDTMKDLSHYLVALEKLQQTLQEISEFIKQFTDAKWYTRLLKAHNFQSEYEEFNQQLEQAINQLNLGLNAQQIINRTQDKEDQQADQAALQSQYQALYALLEKDVAERQQYHGEQAERQELIAKQIESMKALLSGAVLGKPVSRSPVAEHLQVSWFDIDCRQKIAEGSFGKIYEARWKGQPVAVKSIEGSLSAADKAQFIREIQIMSRLHSPYITQFFGACLEEGQACLLLEYMPQQSLYEVLGKQALTGEQQREMALAIARGLYYLHTQGVIHRDLKSANVLVDAHWQAKITDFGLSQMRLTSIQTAKSQSQAIAWMAPECLGREALYTPQSDIYSYGVIVWELVTGRRPYASYTNERALIEAIQAGRQEVIPPHVPEVYRDIMQGCWRRERLQRMGLGEVIRRLEAYEYRPASPTGEALCEQGMAQEAQKEYAQAYALYRRSAEKGYYRGQSNLAHFLLTGQGGAVQDKAEAYQWLLKAAEQGHARAMYNLGRMYEKGDGIGQDNEQALLWYQRAQAEGHPGVEAKITALQEAMETATLRPRIAR